MYRIHLSYYEPTRQALRKLFFNASCSSLVGHEGEADVQRACTSGEDPRGRDALDLKRVYSLFYHRERELI